MRKKYLYANTHTCYTYHLCIYDISIILTNKRSNLILKKKLTLQMNTYHFVKDNKGVLTHHTSTF